MSSADDAELVRSFCGSNIQSTCSYVVHGANYAVQQLPQAIQGLIDNYNLAPGISVMVVNELQQGLDELQSGIDGELTEVEDLSSSEILAAAGSVESGGLGIDGALQQLQEGRCPEPENARAPLATSEGSETTPQCPTLIGGSQSVTRRVRHPLAVSDRGSSCGVRRQDSGLCADPHSLRCSSACR